MTVSPLLPPYDGSTTVLPGFLDFHAKHNADLTCFVYPSQDSSSTVTNVSFREVAEATHRIAHVLRPGRRGPEGDVVAILVHTDAIVYSALMIGVIRAGLVPLPMSPRNSSQAICNMLAKTSCHRIIAQSSLGSLVIDVQSELAQKGFSLQVDDLSTMRAGFQDLISPSHNTNKATIAEPYPTNPSGSKKEDVVFYIHSSGSTGFPKPIPFSHKFLSQWALSDLILGAGRRGFRWGAMTLPQFHAMGIGFQIIYPIVSGQSVSLFAPQYPAPPVVPHPQNTLEVCKLTCSTALTVVPSFLETWAHSDTAIEYLRTLQAICFGGGPLSPKAGDKLVAAGVKITTAYGGTEFGAPAYTFDEDGAQDSEIKPDADWSWLRFSKKPNLRWVPQGDGTYELQILTSEAFGLAVENLPDTRGYATSDLFVPHPTRKGLWRIVGRKDDVLVLSTGEKIVPLHQEEQITANPMIMGALMFGREREQAGILIEPNPEFAIDPTDEAALAAFRNKIWPSVEEANTPAPAFARIFKEMILVTDPSKPFPRAGKGTVIRNQATALYADAIDKLYDTVAQSSDSEGIPPPTSWSTGDIEHWIVKLAASVNDGRIPSSSQSLFEQGFDSLSATFMRNRILGVLRSAEDPSLQKAVSKISPNIVFEHPSVRELATALAGIVDPTSDTSLAPGKIAADAVALVEKYTANLPVQTGQSQSTDGVVVLLTGSTGNIGSHILAALLADNRISKVYTLNRASSTSEDRLATAFRDRDLPVALLSHPKLRSLAGDLSQDNFGLEQSIYTEIINSATHIVHNAWTVNFNHPLSAFEKQIAGVRRVVDICASSPRPVRLLFTSSVGAAGGWRADDGLVPEKPLPNPEIAALNGYAASKYVVEQILSKAAENGLNMVSLRMGQACGSRETGAWGTTEWMPILVKSSIALGCLPDIDGLVSWVPLDAIGGLYIDLLLSEQALPQLMNVVHPRPTQWKNVLAAIGEELGGHLPFVPLDAWVHKLEAYASEPSKQDLDNIPAIKLLTFFRGMATTSTSDKVAANVEAGGMPMFETIQLQRSSLTMRQIPSLDDENARVWVRYWRKRGYIQ